jgi:hypothetical protein
MERRIGVYATWASAQAVPAPADMAPAPASADTDVVPPLPVLHADLAQAAVGTGTAGTASAGSASGTGALDAGVHKAMTVSMEVAGHKKTAEAGLAAPDVH